MSHKQKIEKDYKEYMLAIEQETKKGLKKIHEKVNTIKSETTKIGEALQSENTEIKDKNEKKVNTKHTLV